MAAQAGKDIIVSHKNNAGSPAYEVFAGLRSKSIELNQETVDITNSDSTGLWRQLLAASGVKSARISGAGVFLDSLAENEVLEAFAAGAIRDMKFLIPGFTTMEGPFQVSSMKLSGEYNREVSYDMTWESAGELTLAPIA